MAFFDMPLEKLRTYKTPKNQPRDFDAFWRKTLKDSEAFPLAATFDKLNHAAYKLVDVYDVTFNGYAGQPVKGWFIVPAGASRPLPCLVTYIGYGGGRSLPIDHVAPAVAGLAHFVMDTRGQGSTWSPGNTPDDAWSGPAFPGYMTRGIETPETYYYRRVFTDAVRAISAAASHKLVDAKRIGITGVSQGGGITIAAAALAGKKVKLAMPDVPYLCNFRRAVTLTDTQPYFEISQYLKTHRNKVEEVFHTLAYFDGVNFAPRISARCLFSVGLMDTICPPSTVYAAYNAVKAPKDIRVYEFNNHEGGMMFQAEQRLAYAAKHL